MLHIETNTRFTFTATDEISLVGQTAIHAMLRLLRPAEDAEFVRLNAGRTVPMYLPALPEDFDFSWVVETGDLRGTFPKRVSQHYYKAHGLKLPPRLISDIGNLARTHSSDAITYTFEFVMEFDWKPGTFGDAGSCYWGTRTAARQLLREHGGMAVTFYSEGRGLARAWALLVGDMLILWNGYGMTTQQIARVLAAFWNLTYKRIDLTNNGEDSGLLWINGGTGFVVGAPDVVESVDEYDFDWRDGVACSNCGQYIDEDEIYFSPGYEPMCSECFYQHYETCERCGETIAIEDAVYANDTVYCQYHAPPEVSAK